MYFSWTNIDDIHGDQFKKEEPEQTSFNNLISTVQLKTLQPIQTLELLEIAGKPYYWINETTLFNASTGDIKMVLLGMKQNKWPLDIWYQTSKFLPLN
jgi:hypothetical protein